MVCGAVIWAERFELHGAQIQGAVFESEEPFGFSGIASVGGFRQSVTTAGHIGVIAEAIFPKGVTVFSEECLVAAFNDGPDHASDMEIIEMPPGPQGGVVLIEDSITVDPTK